MHEVLRGVYEKSVEVFRADDRVVAAWMMGSALSKKEDAYSDVDPVFVIRPECYEEFDRELRGFFEAWCDEIVLWWPERFNTATFRNYAVLFVKDSVLLQYDVSVESLPEEARRIQAYELIFDKTGTTFEVSQEEGPPELTQAEIARTIDTYFVWMYIQAKYVRRRDVVKLLYVQQELFHAHVKLAGYLDDDLRGYMWWCDIVKGLKAADQREVMLSYLSGIDFDSLASKIEKQVAAFEEDTRQCCAKFGLPRPGNAQEKIGRHLRESLLSLMG